MLLVSTS